MPDLNHIMHIDCLGNIRYTKLPKTPTAPTIKTQIIDTFTGEPEISGSFRPGAISSEYTMLLDQQEALAQQGNNCLPRATK